MLIAFEGIDGSGKGTHASLLLKNLNSTGYRAELFSFPCYSKTFFGSEVGKYLNGHYGSLDTVPVEFASLLYAGDRLEMRDKLVNSLHINDVVICDRYTPSNLAHQAGKVSGNSRNAIISWIETVEYEIFKLPRPDIVIWLDMPVKVAQNLILEKEKRSYTDKSQDIHEQSYDYLDHVRETYRELSHGTGWLTITCGNEHPRSIDSIQNEIFKLTLKFIKTHKHHARH